MLLGILKKIIHVTKSTGILAPLKYFAMLLEFIKIGPTLLSLLKCFPYIHVITEIFEQVAEFTEILDPCHLS